MTVLMKYCRWCKYRSLSLRSLQEHEDQEHPYDVGRWRCEPNADTEPGDTTTNVWETASTQHLLASLVGVIDILTETITAAGLATDTTEPFLDDLIAESRYRATCQIRTPA